MKDVAQGRCWSCYARGPEGRERNFLCGLCVDPDEVRSYCDGCQVRRSYGPDELAELCARYGITWSPERGTVLRLENCVACGSDLMPQKIEFYAIAP